MKIVRTHHHAMKISQPVGSAHLPPHEAVTSDQHFLHHGRQDVRNQQTTLTTFGHGKVDRGGESFILVNEQGEYVDEVDVDWTDDFNVADVVAELIDEIGLSLVALRLVYDLPDGLLPERLPVFVAIAVKRRIVIAEPVADAV